MSAETIAILIVLEFCVLLIVVAIWREERIEYHGESMFAVEQTEKIDRIHNVGLYVTEVDGKKIEVPAISYSKYFVGSLPSVLSFCNTTVFAPIPGGVRISCNNGDKVNLQTEGYVVYLNGKFSAYKTEDFISKFAFKLWIQPEEFLRQVNTKMLRGWNE